MSGRDQIRAEIYGRDKICPYRTDSSRSKAQRPQTLVHFCERSDRRTSANHGLTATSQTSGRHHETSCLRKHIRYRRFIDFVPTDSRRMRMPALVRPISIWCRRPKVSWCEFIESIESSYLCRYGESPLVHLTCMSTIGRSSLIRLCHSNIDVA